MSYPVTTKIIGAMLSQKPKLSRRPILARLPQGQASETFGRSSEWWGLAVRAGGRDCSSAPELSIGPSVVSNRSITSTAPVLRPSSCRRVGPLAEAGYPAPAAHDPAPYAS